MSYLIAAYAISAVVLLVYLVALVQRIKAANAPQLVAQQLIADDVSQTLTKSDSTEEP
jgi:hypothetical protein